MRRENFDVRRFYRAGRPTNPTNPASPAWPEYTAAGPAGGARRFHERALY
jgi:hypothetical protein